MLTGWDTRQEDARLDMINPHPWRQKMKINSLKHLCQAVPHLDALIIADYIPSGVVSPAGE